MLMTLDSNSFFFQIEKHIFSETHDKHLTPAQPSRGSVRLSSPGTCGRAPQRVDPPPSIRLALRRPIRRRAARIGASQAKRGRENRRWPPPALSAPLAGLLRSCGVRRQMGALLQRRPHLQGSQLAVPTFPHFLFR
jgi:hypothetical protein